MLLTKVMYIVVFMFYRSEQKPEVLPDFDVYAPNSKFKKSSPGLPDFRVIVSRWVV